MGLFLSMSGVVGASKTDVEAALRECIAEHDGRFEPTTKRHPSSEVLIVDEADGNTTVVYPQGFFEWDDTAAYLSRSLDVPVFSFHIHDGDLWLYILFVQGVAVCHFNPIPDYWDDNISDEDQRRWAGDPAAIAHWCPNVQEDAIRSYLVRWNLKDGSPGKAYEGDEFPYGDCWQLVDFMKKLGLSYPFTTDGQPVGDTYVLKW